MGLDKLLEFHKPWNNELICQFYASYHLDSSGDFNTIHWTTEGQHYKVDFVTFSCLLGLESKDRKAPSISKIQAFAMSEYQYMYLEGHQVDG
jgi:hypothetical protein